MRNRRSLLTLGLALGIPLLLALGADTLSGIGPEARAYEDRLREAKTLGFDPGFRLRLARDAARPASARRAFEDLETLLSGRDPFLILVPHDPKNPNARPNGRPAGAVRAELARAANLARAAEGGDHREWSKGAALAFPDLAPLKSAANAADALARDAALRGDYRGATDAVLDAADLWRPFADEPLLITDLVRTSAGAILFRTSGALLADPAYPSAEAARLLAMAEGPDFAPTVPPRAFLVNETVWGFDVLTDPAGVPPDLFSSLASGSSPDRALEYGMKLPRVRRAWASDGLRLFIATARALPSDPADFDRAEAAWAALERDAAAPRGLKGKFSEMVLPVFGQWVEASRLREARRRVLRLAAGLRAGRSEASLRRSPLALDPGDGAPLRIRANAKAPDWLLAPTIGYRKDPARPLPVAPRLTAVYAVGRNRRDDGGVVGKKPEDGDEVLAIPRR